MDADEQVDYISEEEKADADDNGTKSKSTKEKFLTFMDGEEAFVLEYEDEGEEKTKEKKKKKKRL